MNILDENFFWAWMENVHIGATMGTVGLVILIVVLVINLANDKLSIPQRRDYRKWLKRSAAAVCVSSAVASIPLFGDIREAAFERAVTSAITSENVEVITASVSRMVVRTECAVFGCEKK